jgi:NAD(P)H-hydrate epimerase
VPLLTGEEAAAWDRRAIDLVGVPERVLMENAGRGAASILQRLHPKGRVIGMVGAGNNGGDTLVTLRTLAAWGREVSAVVLPDRGHADPLTHGWSIPTTVFNEQDDEWLRLLDDAAVVVDGILGTGVRGAPRAREAGLIRAVNTAGRPVLAMDVPSGVDPATGEVPGEAIDATSTVSFGAPKLGTLLHPARRLVGRLLSIEIGFPPLAPDEAHAFLATPAWAAARMPARSTDTHKNAVGRVLVVGGAAGMAGAVVLAARGALRAGAGIVRIASAAANREIVQAALPDAVWVDAGDPYALEEAVASTDACVVGPGLGKDDWAAGAVGRVLEYAAVSAPGAGAAVLLDADALNLVAAGAVTLEPGGPAIPMLLTPHPGEMERLLGDVEAPRASDAVGRAREAAHRFGCAVLLKGAPSVVAAPGRPVSLDSQGSSDLAAAGMGDTLSGVCGTLIAQGLDPAEAGAVGLVVTGRAARLAGLSVSLTPSDVVEMIPRALAEMIDDEILPVDGVSALPFVNLDAHPVW